MAPKKPQTRLQQKASKAGRIVTGPKGSKPHSTTNAAIQKQGNKITRGGLGSGRPSGTVSQTRPKPVSTGGETKPPSKPDGRRPRAITNGNNPVMRQLRAKAVQTRRVAEGKSTVASRNRKAPTPAQRERLSNLVKQMRVPGDSGYVRAAEARGKAEVAKAQTRRNARSAMKNMEGTLKAARIGRKVAGRAGAQAGPAIRNLARGLASKGAAKGALKGALAAANIGKFATPVGAALAVGELAQYGVSKEEVKRTKAAGTGKQTNLRGGKSVKDTSRKAAAAAAAAGSTSKFKGARDAAVRKAAAIKGSPVVGSGKAKSASGSSASNFDSSFAAARKAGKSTFTWKGKKYTTKMK